MRGHEPFSQSSVGHLLPHGQGSSSSSLQCWLGVSALPRPGTHSPPRQWSCRRLPVLLVGEGVTSDPCRHKVLWPGPQSSLYLASAEIRCVLPSSRTGRPRQLLCHGPAHALLCQRGCRGLPAGWPSSWLESLLPPPPGLSRALHSIIQSSALSEFLHCPPAGVI